MSRATAFPASEQRELLPSTFEIALAEYHAACADRDRLRIALGGEWTPELGKARLEELRAWIVFKQLA